MALDTDSELHRRELTLLARVIVHLADKLVDHFTPLAEDVADCVEWARETVRQDNETVLVQFNWSTRWGTCYDCGLPAAFRVVYEASDPEAAKRCAVCAANAAAEGELIARIEPLDQLLIPRAISSKLGGDGD